MKCFVLSLFLVAFASCSRFSTPHYRKLRLVPATESAIYTCRNSGNEHKSTVVITENPEVNCMGSEDSVAVVENNKSQEKRIASQLTSFVEVNSVVKSESVLKVKETNIDQPAHVRRDWSVLIAILLLFGGISLLLWSIAISIALPAPFWVRLLIGIGMIPLSVRMILLGARILINRFRNPVNYKESQH